MASSSRSTRGLHVVTSALDDPSLAAAHTEQGDISASYGFKALATVVFDIDAGQHLDALYPATCGLSDDARKSIAHLALPHSNKQDEGDTQFIVRFRASTKESADFLYAFVLFRQQRDNTRSRGYLQRALVVVTTKPYVDLYDRLLRVAGPLFFQAGNTVLEALHENISQWPALVMDTPLSLPLAGTYISCVVPDLLDYNRIDATRISRSIHSSSPTGHFIADNSEEALDQIDDDEGGGGGGFDDDDAAGGDEDSHVSELSGGNENDAVVERGKFIVTKHAAPPPSPSFGDVLAAKRSSQCTAFESVGLYSSFMGLESCLWQLWQFAITGESMVVLSPHARTCSQATLAFTSLIAPLQFQGDYRPYYTLYEADFDEIASRQGNGVSAPERMTVIGTTNPFFMKSFKRWPNAVIFPFLETTATSDNKPSSSSSSASINDSDCVSIRIKPTVDLDTLEDSDRAVLLRRRPRYVNVDATVLNQLVSPPQVFITQTASSEDEPYVAINNAILRRHFFKLTKRFLRPFDQYFGVWKASFTNSNLYVSMENVLKPFELKSFLSSVDPRKLPSQLKKSKWRTLYTAFIRSPHFEPWFNYRRRLCIFQFTQTLRVLRATVTPQMLLLSPCGKLLGLDQCEALEQEIMAALKDEQAQHALIAHIAQRNAETEAEESDAIRVSKAHLDAVRKRIQELLL